MSSHKVKTPKAVTMSGRVLNDTQKEALVHTQAVDKTMKKPAALYEGPDEEMKSLLRFIETDEERISLPRSDGTVAIFEKAKTGSLSPAVPNQNYVALIARNTGADGKLLQMAQLCFVDKRTGLALPAHISVVGQHSVPRSVYGANKKEAFERIVGNSLDLEQKVLNLSQYASYDLYAKAQIAANKPIADEFDLWPTAIHSVRSENLEAFRRSTVLQYQKTVLTLKVQADLSNAMMLTLPTLYKGLFEIDTLSNTALQSSSCVPDVPITDDLQLVFNYTPPNMPYSVAFITLARYALKNKMGIVKRPILLFPCLKDILERRDRAFDVKEVMMDMTKRIPLSMPKVLVESGGRDYTMTLCEMTNSLGIRCAFYLIRIRAMETALINAVEELGEQLANEVVGAQLDVIFRMASLVFGYTVQPRAPIVCQLEATTRSQILLTLVDGHFLVLESASNEDEAKVVLQTMQQRQAEICSTWKRAEEIKITQTKVAAYHVNESEYNAHNCQVIINGNAIDFVTEDKRPALVDSLVR